MALKDSKEFQEYYQTLRILSESTDDILFLADVDTGQTYLAGSVSRYLIPSGEDQVLQSEDWSRLVYDRDLPLCRTAIEVLRSHKGDTLNLDYRLHDRAGNLIWVNCRGKVVSEHTESPRLMIGRVSDTAFVGKADTLTGLLNTTRLMSDFSLCLNARQDGILLVLGIDNFKHINNKYGRAYGNEILKKIAATLENHISSNHQAYRLDGDRFAVNFAGSREDAVIAFYHDTNNLLKDCCTFSAGAVKYPLAEISDAGTYFLYSESTLDRAKKQGKNRLLFFSVEDYEKQLFLIDLTEEMRGSIRNNFEGFSLHYQPQVAMSSYTVTGAEALLRYNSAYRGIISPGVFIDLIEQNGMIIPIGNWVLREAITQCKKWREYVPDFRMSINLSYVQIKQKGLAEYIFQLLDEAQLPGSAIILELTESMPLQDYTNFNRLFYLFEKRGILISIDDFGTGYSSLSYLKSLAIDEIKIDRCFVKSIHLSAYNYRLLDNIIRLAHSSQIHVCCEGVEILEELQTLELLKPELLQGNYFSKALPALEFQKQFISAHTQELHWKAMISAAKKSSGADTPSLSFDDNYLSILEQLEEVIYIIDMESLEIMYMNAAGKRFFETTDYAGQKCYRLIMGKNDPCRSCQNQKLSCTQPCTSYFNTDPSRNQLLLQSKRIQWHGRQARLTIGTDLSSINQQFWNLEDSLHVEQSIVRSISLLNRTPDSALAIRKFLQYVGEFHKADRCNIFLYSQAEDSWQSLCIWSEHKGKSQRFTLSSLPDSLLTSWKQSFERGLAVIVKDTAAYKDTDEHLWEVLSMYNTRRMIVSPLQHMGDIFGFLTISNPKFLPSDSHFVDTAVPFLAAHLLHNGFRTTGAQSVATISSIRRQEDILRDVKLGLWVITIDQNTGKNRMYVSDNMNSLLGVKEELNSEQYYYHWYDNIIDGYYNYVNTAVDEMISTGKIVQLEYTWNHPDRGEVPVRCVGSLSRSENCVYTLSGYHRIIDDMTQPRFLDKQLFEIFEYNEQRHSIYFHSSRTLIAGTNEKETDFPKCWIDQGIVHPYFADGFRQLLSSVADRQEDQALDLLLKNRQDEYNWFRMETQHLSTEKQDMHTLIISLYPIQENQKVQLQYVRKDDFYQAMLSETAAHLELNLTTGKIDNSSGIWMPYAEKCQKSGSSFQGLIDEYADSVIHPADCESFRRLIDVSHIREACHDENTNLHYQYRRLMKDGSYHWMELVIHVFHEQITQDMHALLYIKDIDSVKKRHLEQERAANLDPLTGTLNRRTFEQYVNTYMQETEAPEDVCALLLFDLDDFKKINDTKGHLVGDEILRTFVSQLQSTFRSSDYIGRLGGDEFVVFIKNYISRTVLEERLASLQSRLRENTNLPFSCSVGIDLIHREDFDYNQNLKHTDKALYDSKRRGKNTFCYWEPSTEASAPQK